MKQEASVATELVGGRKLLGHRPLFGKCPFNRPRASIVDDMCSTNMEDDNSWHPDDERPSKKLKKGGSATSSKRSKANRKGGRQAKPNEPERLEPDPDSNAKNIRFDTLQAEPSSGSIRTLPLSPPEECDDVATQCEVNLPEDTEEVMDERATQYVESIEPDLSTVVRGNDQAPPLPSFERQHCVGNGEPSKRRRACSAPDRRCSSTRNIASPDDTCIVTELLPGRLGKLLPLGTRVRRPAGKLVQLVAHVIHESPNKALRVQHVYTALQNRYPYFRFMSKKEVTTWKSSIRHALYQKWFKKVIIKNMDPASDTKAASNAKSNFWKIDYVNRPREWDMPDAPQGKQCEDGNLNEVLVPVKGTCKPPKPALSTRQGPSADLRVPKPAMPFVRSKELEGRMSPISSPSLQQHPEYKVLLCPEAAMQRLKYDNHNQQQHRHHHPQNQHLQQQEQHQHCQGPHQSPAWATTTISTPPTSPSPPSRGGDYENSPTWRMLSPPPYCKNFGDIAAGIRCGPFGTQAPESRPSSRHPSSSQPASPHSAMPLFVGSRVRQPSDVEQQLHKPLRDHDAKTEPHAGPSCPSPYIRRKQNSQPCTENAQSAGSDFNHRSHWNDEEHSTGSNSELWTGHVRTKKYPESDAGIVLRRPLPPPPSQNSPQLTQDPAAPPVRRRSARPWPQQAPQLSSEHELRSRHKSSLSMERLAQEQETIRPSLPFPSRPSSRRSRGDKLQKGEPPAASSEPLSAKEHLSLQGRDSPARPDFILKGRWVPGPPSRPWYTRYDPCKLPVVPSVYQPVYSAIAEPVDVVRMQDGTVYILSWPTVLNVHSCAEHARCEWE